jgi:hypothetical protein
VLHEYAQCESSTDLPADMPHIAIKRIGGGSRSNNPNKFLDDVKTLELALRSETDEELIRRYTFYLGRSREHAHLPAEAIDAYEQRAALGGFADEICVGLMSAGHLSQQLGRATSSVLDCYLRAYDRAPWRAEPLFYAATFCRQQDRLSLAYQFALAAAAIPHPGEGTFLESAVYQWQCEFELSISAWYFGDWERGIAACHSVLCSTDLPQEYRTLTESNLALYSPRKTDQT